jgi:cation:H+ antiporter
MGGLAVGNMLGGIAVIIGLILSINLILHKNIGTNGSLSATIPAFLVIISPFLLGFDAKFGIFDGLIMMSLYLALIFYLYKKGQKEQGEGLALIDKKKVAKAIFLALLGVVLVVIISNLAIEVATMVLEKLAISRLMLGMLIFSLGTNLPEITIAFTSWRRKASELSLSYLLSSAFTNILVLGILAVLKPISFKMDLGYFILAGAVSIIMILFVVFSYSKKNLSRLEGFIMLTIYLAFLGPNIYLIAN